jgi:hypothetical protein
MSKVVVDEAIKDKLRNFAEAELLDESGQMVGHFLSEELYRRLIYDWANAQITDEELERRRRAPGGRTLEEIWARLQRS